MRDQHPDGGAGGNGGGLRERFGTTGGQVQGFWSHARGRRVRQGPAHRRVPCSLECKVIDGKLSAKYNFFVLEVVKAWIDPSRKHPRTIHHQGEGVFMIAGRTIHLPSPITSRA